MKKIRFESASTTRVDQFHEEVSELLRYLASMLKEPEDTEDEWLAYAFVSDESRLADFFYQEWELKHLEKLSGMTGLTMRDLICDLDYALYQSKQTEELKPL